MTGVPEQAPLIGVITKVTVPETVFVVLMVWTGIVVVPEGRKPVIPLVAEAAQPMVSVLGLTVKFTKVVGEPEQMVWLKVVFVITGAVLTLKVCVAVLDGPHSFVTTKETV